MKYRLNFLSLWLLIFLCVNLNAQIYSGDTTAKNNDPGIKNKVEIFVASYFLFNKNWKGENNLSVVLAGTLNISINKENKNRNQILEIRGDINYQKFIDSSWIKNNDNFFMSSIWVNKYQGQIKSSFQQSIKTQCTNTWEYSSSTPGFRKWKSGPFLPFTFIAGYGINKKFRNNSYINISLISINLESMPRKESTIRDENVIATTNKIIFNSEFGINIQTVLTKKLTRNIIWENKAVAFSDYTDFKNLNLDIQNILSVVPYRFIKIRLTHNLIYNKMLYDKIQNRYELLIGLMLEK
jgi:hypothetical protein